MKYLNLILILLLLNSCKKETCSDGVKNQDEVEADCGGICAACGITYPETGAYGVNVLFGTDTLRVMEEENSFRAVIPEGSSVKIELTRLSGVGWGYASAQNWTVVPVSPTTTAFSNLNEGVADLILHIPDNTMNEDTILIKYFENGSSETRRKILIKEVD